MLAWQSFTVQQQQAVALQREVAQRVSTQVTAFIQELESELRTVTQVRGLQGLSREQQRAILTELQSYQDAFEVLTLLDNEGRELVNLSRLEVASSAYLGERAGSDEFEVPKTSGEVYYGPVRFDEVTGDPLMKIAVPIVDVRSGLVDSVLVADVRLKKIWDLIAGIRIGEGGSVYVVDAQGSVVAHRNPSVVLRGTDFDVPDWDGIHTGLSGTGVILAADRVRFGSQEFDIVTERPVSEALALAISTGFIIAVLIVVALVLAGGLGFLAVRQIIRPVEALSATAQAISGGDLSKRAEVTRRDEIGGLAEAFNSMTSQLQELIGSLEQRVADRTRNLQAAADISRATTSVLDPDQLLRQTVDLVRERFDLYYVGLFLVNEDRRFAVLRAGTGEAGQQMLARGHQLEVGGDSMIGQCVARDQARIALDVGEEAAWTDNPFLPHTRSEMALPLRSRGRVIGAMTVQSTQAAAFEESDIAVMQTMADQVAVAIDNARLFADAERLFAESQVALEEVEATHRRYLGQAWADYVRSRAASGYLYSKEREYSEKHEQSEAGMVSLGAGILPEVRRAMTARRPIAGKDNFDTADHAEESSSSALVAPIMLRGQPIGALGLKRAEGDQQWSADEVALVEVIAEQFALAADNLRLLDETRQRAARERVVGEVTARMRESLDLETMLKTAADEMRQSLKLDRVLVHLVTPEADDDSA